MFIGQACANMNLAIGVSCKEGGDNMKIGLRRGTVIVEGHRAECTDGKITLAEFENWLEGSFPNRKKKE